MKIHASAWFHACKMLQLRTVFKLHVKESWGQDTGNTKNPVDRVKFCLTSMLVAEIALVGNIFSCVGSSRSPDKLRLRERREI